MRALKTNNNGFFMEMSYITIGDPYKEKTHCVSREVDKEKQLKIKQQRRKVQRGPDLNDKMTEYPRLFIGECLNTYRSARRNTNPYKNIGPTWIPAGRMKKVCGSGGLDYGRPISFLESKFSDIKKEPPSSFVVNTICDHDFSGWFNGVGGDPYPKYMHENEVVSKKRTFVESRFVQSVPFISVCKPKATFTSDNEMYRSVEVPEKRKKKKDVKVSISNQPKRKFTPKRKSSVKNDPYKDPIIPFRPKTENLKPFYPQKGPKSKRTPSILQTLINKKVNCRNRKYIKRIF